MSGLESTDSGELQVAGRGWPCKSKQGDLERCVISEAVVASGEASRIDQAPDNQGKVLARVTKKFSSSMASGEVEVTEKPVFPHLFLVPS